MRMRIEHCAQRIAEEERLALEASTHEERAAHLHAAMQYQAQLTSLSKRHDRGSPRQA